ncbi:MAG: hypothetical protein ACWA41_06695 [Putridiphycobacter sp.]
MLKFKFLLIGIMPILAWSAPLKTTQRKEILSDQIGGKFQKTVIGRIDAFQKINVQLFGPTNGALASYDFTPKNGFVLDVKINEDNKNTFNWNLYTILFYHIAKGDLTIYSDIDTVDFTKRMWGELTFPIVSKFDKGMSTKYSAFSQKLIDKEVLGFYNRTETFPMPSEMYPGEDSIDANGDVVYYPHDFFFYADSDVMGYKINETWIVNKKGEVLDKRIKSIAPEIIQVDGYTGEEFVKTPFWIDYKELSPLLKSYYLLLNRYRTDRILSFYEFFEKREFFAEIEKEQKNFPVKK